MTDLRVRAAAVNVDAATQRVARCRADLADPLGATVAPWQVEQMRVQQLLRLEAAKGDLAAATKAEQDLMTRMESAA